MPSTAIHFKHPFKYQKCCMFFLQMVAHPFKENEKNNTLENDRVNGENK